MKPKCYFQKVSSFNYNTMQRIITINRLNNFTFNLVEFISE